MATLRFEFLGILALLLASRAFAAEAPPSTPEELKRQGTEIVSHGAAVSQQVQKLLEAARSDDDMIKTGCLDGKLAQINAIQRIAEKRLETLTTTVDAARRNHEFIVLTVLGQKLQVLDQEASQCNGQNMYDTGETTVEMVIDGETIKFEDNPSDVAPPPPPTLDTVPPPMSPTK
jgi:hypothetical protein